MRPRITSPIPFRDADPSKVDGVLGKKRKADTDVDFSDCPLAQRYPTWDAYHIQLAEERAAAIREGRAPHPAAAEPKKVTAYPTDHNYGVSEAPWEDGPEVGEVLRLRYEDNKPTKTRPERDLTLSADVVSAPEVQAFLRG